LTVERNLMISVLKLTKDGSAPLEDVKKESRLSSDTMLNLLEKLQVEKLLKTNNSSVTADSENRLRLAVKAVSLGADIEVVSSYLHWQEFESIAATALKNNGYVVKKNVRFQQTARRWEIDAVGCRKPLVVCVDCKDWHKALSLSSMRRIVEAQVERTRALADALPNVKVKLECVKWNRAKFVPVVLVLMPSRFKFYDNTPIVPVLQLQDFLFQLPLEVESLRYFPKEFIHLSHDFQERSPSEP
jgi:Holliday junction resolvase-like predicted endonuclease